jgi:LysM repeat protein
LFDYEDEYKKATQSAMVNTYEVQDGLNWRALFVNGVLLSAFAGIGYFGFIYLKNETTFFNKTTAVMGATHTINDAEYLKQLTNSMDEEVNRVNVSDALSSIVNTSTLRDNSLYTQAISQEIDGTYHQNSRVILVEKGDTLASISEEYYGNSMEFDKIIEANERLNKDSKIIHIGQKLHVPY